MDRRPLHLSLWTCQTCRATIKGPDADAVVMTLYLHPVGPRAYFTPTVRGHIVEVCSTMYNFTQGFFISPRQFFSSWFITHSFPLSRAEMLSRNPKSWHTAYHVRKISASFRAREKMAVCEEKTEKLHSWVTWEFPTVCPLLRCMHLGTVNLWLHRWGWGLSQRES